MSSPETTILLDIYEKLGSIDAKMTEMTKQHDEMAETVSDLKDFKARIGAYIWLGGTFVAGVCVLLWNGLQYFSAEIRGALSRLFH